MEAINAVSKMIPFPATGLEITMIVILVIVLSLTAIIIIRQQKKRRGEIPPLLTAEQKKRKKEREKKRKYEKIALAIKASPEYQRKMADLYWQGVSHIDELLKNEKEQGKQDKQDKQ